MGTSSAFRAAPPHKLSPKATAEDNTFGMGARDIVFIRLVLAAFLILLRCLHGLTSVQDVPNALHGVGLSGDARHGLFGRCFLVATRRFGGQRCLRS